MFPRWWNAVKENIVKVLHTRSSLLRRKIARPLLPLQAASHSWARLDKTELVQIPGRDADK